MAGRGRFGATTARRLTAVVLSLGSTVVSLGCSQTTSRQPVPGLCTPFTVVSSTPSDGAEGVATDASVSLGFSDFPDPETVQLDTVLLSSGAQTRLGTFQVDLISQSIRFRTRNRLWPNLTYLVTVLSDVQSLQGCPAKTNQRTFRTGDGPTDPPVLPEPVPSFSGEILPIFAARCSGSDCHRRDADGGDDCVSAPAKGLSLCNTQAWNALVGVPSAELAGMRRVLPGDASRSYLMRKLIPGGSGGGPIPTTPGHRDPPDGPLDESDLRRISDWIDGGAPR